MLDLDLGSEIRVESFGRHSRPFTTWSGSVFLGSPPGSSPPHIYTHSPESQPKHRPFPTLHVFSVPFLTGIMTPALRFGSGGGGGHGMDGESGVNRCKLLPLEWISNAIMLYSTGNYV